MAAGEIIYAVHDFEAENPDEISFRTGERIIVIEKDDQYQDGWWQGENEAGQRGLFPQSYTSNEPPSHPATPTNASHATPVVQSGPFPQTGASDDSVAKRDIPILSDPPGQDERTTTIDDIQNHLDGMYQGSRLSHSQDLPGVIPPAIENESHSRVLLPAEEVPVANAQVPKVETPGDDDASVASKSLRDDASSILSREVDQDDGKNTGEDMASRAKQNLARNIQLAQEREDKRRVAEEREMEAERERLRLGAPPVEGLVLSDESDHDEGDSDDDDDSIFPSRNVPHQQAQHYSYAQEAQNTPLVAVSQDIPQTSAAMEPSPTFQAASSTPLPSSPKAPSQEAETASSARPVYTSNNPTEPQLYLAPQYTDSSALQTSSSVSSLYRPTPHDTPAQERPAQADFDRESNMVEAETSYSAPPPSTFAVTSTTTALPTNGQHLPSVEASEPVEARDPAANKPLSVETATAIHSTNQISRVSGARRSIDAGVAPGEEGLLSLVEQAKNGDHSQASQTALAPSPRQSTAGGSSRTDSALGTAFTPATTAPYDSSPRSGNFARNRVPSDPREWSVDHVLEWGQSKNFDSTVLGKFREHEISGDVLVDMDVNTLKEIDILAFGPRARIAKAIKELRSIYDPSAVISPIQSERDSSSLRGGSTRGGSVGDGLSPHANTTAPQTPTTDQGPPLKPTQQETLTGLGLQDVASSETPANRSPFILRSITQSFSNKSSPSPAASGTPKSVASRATAAEGEDRLGDRQEATEDLRATAIQEEPEVSGSPAARSGGTASVSLGRSGRQKSQAGSIAERSEKGSSGRGFFTNTFPRNRKPPPRYPSSSDLDKVGIAEARPGPRSSTGSNRLSTRLFGMGGTTPAASPSSRDLSKGSISAPLQASDEHTSTMSPAPLPSSPKAAAAPTSPSRGTPSTARPPVTSAPDTAAGAGVTSAQRIGEPDYSGFLRKRGERYNTWKERYLILKGIHLYILKSPNEQKVKGWINLSGYKFVSDGSVGGIGEKNKYGFKAIGENRQAHYFSSADPATTRNWMKALMKATIGRDFTAPVTSSANIKTIPLSVAQSMNPPPRPPSPTSARNVQKASLQHNPDALSASDAAKLMGAAIVPSGSVSNGIGQSPYSRKRTDSLTFASGDEAGTSLGNSPEKRKSSMGSLILPLRGKSTRKKPMVADENAVETLSPPQAAHGQEDITPRPSSTFDGSYRSPEDVPVSPRFNSLPPQVPVSPPTTMRQTSYARILASSATAPQDTPESQELLDWINSHLPAGTPKATEWADMGSGRLFTRLVENLSGKASKIPDAEFDNFRPAQPGRAPNMDYIDTLFKCFDYLLDRRIDTADVSINDLMTSNQPHMVKLAEIIRMRFET